MPKYSHRFLTLLIVLLFPVLTTNSDFQTNGHTVVWTESVIAGPTPCKEIQITKRGVICKTNFNLTVSLDFPTVNLKAVLVGDEFLPRAKGTATAHERIADGQRYRNLAFTLRWEPNTPAFLQIYLSDYLPYWGRQIPYRLFWGFNYEACSSGECTEWARFEQKGEILPSAIPNLPSDLAADSNFNGVPAAFWNNNVTP